jgi:hypothetical protein
VHTEAFEDISITLCINDTRNKLLLKQGLPWKFMLMGQRPININGKGPLDRVLLSPSDHPQNTFFANFWGKCMKFTKCCDKDS